MKKSPKKHNNYLKIIILIIIFGVCIKLIIEHELYGEYHDFGWRSKALILFLTLYSFIDLFKEIRTWLKRRKLGQ